MAEPGQNVKKDVKAQLYNIRIKVTDKQTKRRDRKLRRKG